jgi:hypothetical protein
MSFVGGRLERGEFAVSEDTDHPGDSVGVNHQHGYMALSNYPVGTARPPHFRVCADRKTNGNCRLVPARSGQRGKHVATRRGMVNEGCETMSTASIGEV